ncbi:MAG: hypothetical protein FJY37_18355 [Betaproteobacteria bacterium]|nr:hypothetical protein [Betaproteobacteria bacterium]
MRALILVVLVVSLTGCATRPIGKIPVESEEFTRDLQVLKQAYPEIQAHWQTLFRKHHCVPISDLVSQWGAPDETSTVWYQLPLVTAPYVFFPPAGLFVAGMGFAMQPVLPKQYT